MLAFYICLSSSQKYGQAYEQHHAKSIRRQYSIYYTRFSDSLKMVYRRPKLIKTPQWANQVTGPWMDSSFVTETINSEADMTRDGTAAMVLKRNIVPFLKQVDISEVGVYPEPPKCQLSSNIRHALPFQRLHCS